MIRDYVAEKDLEALAGIYREGVRQVAPAIYSPDQVNAWAAWPDDLDAFAAILKEGRTLVALENDAHAAFAQLHPATHVNLLYTHPDHMRRGHASRLLEELERIARDAGSPFLTTNASFISKPLFLRHGYRLIEEDEALYAGIAFIRSRMRKDLAPSIAGERKKNGTLE